MKSYDIVALLKAGKKPMVRVTGPLWDDGWGEVGMLARIVSFREDLQGDDPMVELKFDYNENKAHNLALQSHEYYLRGGGTGTAFESGLMKEDDINEEVYFMLAGDGSEVQVELADSPILAEYIKSGSQLTYVAWLEKFIEDNVPECMKPWSKL